MAFVQMSSSPSLSSAMTSSSFAKPTVGQPFCYCEVPATLRYSHTGRNPRRPFLGCSKYNTEGLPYCKFFKWADGNHEYELQLQECLNELLRSQRELEKKLDDIKKTLIQLCKRVEETEKRELGLQKQKVENCRSRRLLGLYWTFVVIVSCYVVLCR
ncbi:uncharacterized protein LOC121248559 [Juglans microcarpa x Juglans regia]|uniref:uncharacterized protein LOC121248559 n=1 Tax=Juglans microcarpa x Juglans regia TaxID=2249226 RepID=UPI001B7EBF65|nr:uncharacterized protein LOC121248559 [Juglans microcarpa x Juglans regia]